MAKILFLCVKSGIHHTEVHYLLDLDVGILARRPTPEMVPYVPRIDGHTLNLLDANASVLEKVLEQTFPFHEKNRANLRELIASDDAIFAAEKRNILPYPQVSPSEILRADGLWFPGHFLPMEHPALYVAGILGTRLRERHALVVQVVSQFHRSNLQDFTVVIPVGLTEVADKA